MKKSILLLLAVISCCCLNLFAGTTALTLEESGRCKVEFHFKAPQEGFHFKKGEKIHIEVIASNPRVTSFMQLWVNNTRLHTEKRAPYEWGGHRDDRPLYRLPHGKHMLTCKIKDTCGKWHRIECPIFIDKDQKPPVKRCEWEGYFCKAPESCYKGHFEVCVGFENERQIKRCTLYIGGEKVGVDSRAPFKWDSRQYRALQNLTPGSHTLTCVAWDECGNSDEFKQTICVDDKTPVPDNCKVTAKFGCIPMKKGCAPSSFKVCLDIPPNRFVQACQLFVNGKPYRIIRSGSFAWNVRNLIPGREYTLKCVVYKRCGKPQEFYQKICVGKEPAPQPGQCDWEAEFTCPPVKECVPKDFNVCVKFVDLPERIKACKLIIGRRSFGWKNKAPFEWKVSVRRYGNYNVKCLVVDECGKQKMITHKVCVDKAPINR